MRGYEYRHVVGFEETNLVGNVYFTRYLSWQGRCRELFIRDHAREVMDDLGAGLHMVTTRVTCDYLAELHALDEVAIRMRLAAMSESRVAMAFEYARLNGGGEQVVARGEHEIACLRASDGRLEPAPVPAALRAALTDYALEEAVV
jgi:enediyne biosynthesis thioesterase